MILGDEPTYAYVPLVYYYQGRVREGLGRPALPIPTAEYLAIRGNSTDDPLVAEIRKRVGGKRVALDRPSASAPSPPQ